jgi:hypothetical protein
MGSIIEQSSISTSIVTGTYDEKAYTKVLEPIIRWPHKKNNIDGGWLFLIEAWTWGWISSNIERLMQELFKKI